MFKLIHSYLHLGFHNNSFHSLLIHFIQTSIITVQLKSYEDCMGICVMNASTSNVGYTVMKETQV